MDEHSPPEAAAGPAADPVTEQPHFDYNSRFEVPVDYLAMTRAAAKNEQVNRRFSVPESRFYRLFWRPWKLTLGCGLAALILFYLAFCLGDLLHLSAVSPPAWLSLCRMLAMFGGAICLMTAAPLFKPRDWTPEKGDEEIARSIAFRQRHSHWPKD